MNGKTADLLAELAGLKRSAAEQLAPTDQGPGRLFGDKGAGWRALGRRPRQVRAYQLTLDGTNQMVVGNDARRVLLLFSGGNVGSSTELWPMGPVQGTGITLDDLEPPFIVTRELHDPLPSLEWWAVGNAGLPLNVIEVTEG